MTHAKKSVEYTRYSDCYIIRFKYYNRNSEWFQPPWPMVIFTCLVSHVLFAAVSSPVGKRLSISRRNMFFWNGSEHRSVNIKPPWKADELISWRNAVRCSRGEVGELLHVISLVSVPLVINLATSIILATITACYHLATSSYYLLPIIYCTSSLLLTSSTTYYHDYITY